MFPLPQDLGLDNFVGDFPHIHFRITALELGEDVHSLDDPAEASMSPIKLRRGPESQEELRASGIAPRMGHTQTAAEMAAVFRLVALAVNLITGSPPAVPF